MRLLPFDVLDYLGDTGQQGQQLDKVQTHLDTVTAMVKAYVRGRGFTDTGEPADDLARIIVSSTARLVSNPTHTVTSQIDDYSVRHGVFDGWTLPELAVLHNYRRRTA